ncbi:MAG TPA: PspC domain-containing protein [Anaerolineaceae bacterium]|jgi:phage shock protein C|nr:PspC domain-containing protein [Anaerolineaceae bacterium]
MEEIVENTKKLYRSRTDRQLGGVCSGLANYFRIDPTVIRLIFVLGFFLTGSATFWLYLVMWIVIPEEPL